jgi:hypothetical protein
MMLPCALSCLIMPLCSVFGMVYHEGVAGTTPARVSSVRRSTRAAYRTVIARAGCRRPWPSAAPIRWKPIAPRPAARRPSLADESTTRVCHESGTRPRRILVEAHRFLSGRHMSASSQNRAQRELSAKREQDLLVANIFGLLSSYLRCIYRKPQGWDLGGLKRTR